MLKLLLVSHPTVITLLHSHNYPIKSAHASTFQPVSKDTIDAYYQLFAMVTLLHQLVIHTKQN